MEPVTVFVKTILLMSIEIFLFHESYLLLPNQVNTHCHLGDKNAGTLSTSISFVNSDLQKISASSKLSPIPYIKTSKHVDHQIRYIKNTT